MAPKQTAQDPISSDRKAASLMGLALHFKCMVGALFALKNQVIVRQPLNDSVAYLKSSGGSSGRQAACGSADITPNLRNCGEVTDSGQCPGLRMDGTDELIHQLDLNQCVDCNVNFLKSNNLERDLCGNDEIHDEGQI